VRPRTIVRIGLAAAAIAGGLAIPPGSRAAATAPTTYAADLVSTRAIGVAMNGSGDVVGRAETAPTCDGCPPGEEAVVWRANGDRFVLPSLAGRPTVEVRGINASRWVAGSASNSEVSPHAVAWKPGRAGYKAIDLGVLPNTTISTAAGIDDSRRVVGYSTTETFPPTGAPFMWTKDGGMVDLAAQGFPNETPLAISPGGTVAVPTSWYRLGDPASVTPLASPPQGFLTPGNFPRAINDAGDQVAFLRSTSTHLLYLFRYHHEGTWQQLSSLGAGVFGMGGINNAEDVTATIGQLGLIAYGPAGLSQNLADFLSPAYANAEVTTGGPINDAGQILAEVMIGQSTRLMRLVPVQPCASSCTKVSKLNMVGEFIPDPGDPDACTPNASNHVEATVTVTDENGTPLPGVDVTGHFLDDYWLDKAVAGTTNSKGRIRFIHDGPACVGAVAFLVDGAAGTGRTFDRTTGIVTNWVIPLP
jgi:hypothetical protein